MTEMTPVAEQKSPRAYQPTKPLTSLDGLPVMLDSKTVAAVLGVSVRHVLYLLENDKLKGIRIGSTWRVGRDYLLHDVLGLA